MEYDCVIVGGGAVGATLALTLAQLKCKVLLLEKEKSLSNRAQSDFETRTLGLSYASHFIYDTLGIWNQLNTVPIKQVLVSVKGKFGSCCLDHRDQGICALGYVVGWSDLEHTLYQALEKSDYVDIYQGEKIIEKVYQHHLDNWQLSITKKNETKIITCRLLVAADGVTSLLREEQKITLKKIKYDHCAVMANVKMVNMPEGAAIERFLQEGAIALLPWKQNYATCVWTAQLQFAQMLKALSNEAYIHQCQQQLGSRVGTITEIGKRLYLPLENGIGLSPIWPSVLLLGNAAHSLHPIAAQGLNLSLRDIWQLRKQVIKNKNDLGSKEFLNEYVSARQRDQAKVVFATDKMARFMSGGPLPTWLRALGITLFDSLLPIKNKFTRLCMGLAS